MSAGCGVSSFAHNEKNIRCITDDHNTSNILKRGVVVYNRVVLVFVGKTRLPFSCQSAIIVFHYYYYHLFQVFFACLHYAQNTVNVLLTNIIQ